MIGFFRRAATVFCVTILMASMATAQSGPFEPGWKLDEDASTLRFQSVKNESKVESSTFASLSGAIDTDGTAVIKVLLDSVDTKIDLRNVRMRFLFFETFLHPEATVTVQLTPQIIADLETVRRKVITLPYTISLHGISKKLEAQLAITLIGTDLVAVSTNEPISLSVADFDLMGGLEKLQDAANVKIVPSSTVTFDFIFKRQPTGDAPQVVATATAPASAALEAEGDFSREACVGRFEILSRTGNIYFTPASARLDAKSSALLDTVVDIVKRCPELIIQVAGHTDSRGSDSTNQRLSEQRAASVANYLTSKGIETRRIVSVGMGETRPVAGNDTAKGRSQNRRIEFSPANG